MMRVATYGPKGAKIQIVRNQKAFTKEDFVKTRFLFRILFLVAFMAILSLFYIWSRVQIVQYGYDINNLRSRNDTLVEESKRLNVETAMLKSPGRITAIARQKLKMQTPGPEQIKILNLK
ncbi:MAG: cell division protein FtsL [Deltaproteobacteria bacterium]|nr:cell division protein FtsL [Deltaproteobacteria bacterium]